MNSNTAAQRSLRFHAITIGLHWLTLLLLIAVYAFIELREVYPKGSVMREGMKAWHFSSGLLVFALVILRLGARALFSAPPIDPPTPRWQMLLSSAMDLALYAYLIATPLLGWLTLSAKGKAIPFFGRGLPALISPDKALAESLESAHETMGYIGLALIALHTLAALFHHYIRRDNALRRMLPAG